MAVQSILPKTDLKWDDIRDTLNANGGAVTNVVSTAFAESANFNKWSKHKPVDFGVLFCQDFDSSKPNYVSDWWKSRNGNCGFIPYTTGNYTLAPEIIDGAMNGWTYNYPHGNENSPYRIGDYAGYYKDAVPPIFNFTVPSKAGNSSTTSRIYPSAMIQMTPDNKSIHHSEIEGLSDRHFGVYMKQDNGNRYVRAFAEGTIGNNDVSVEIKTYGLPEGTYTVYPLAAKNAMAQDITDIANNYMTIPYLSSAKIEIVSSLFTVKVTGEVNTLLKTVSYQVTVENEQGASVSLTGNSVHLRYMDKDWGDAFVANEQQKSIPDTTVGMGTTQIASGFFTNVNVDLLNNCKIMVTLMTGAYRGWVVPMKSVDPDQ